MKRLPEFDTARCKKCGICTHFCSTRAIEMGESGVPCLTDPKACTSCALCRDMCPDWAVRLREAALSEAKAGDVEQIA